MGAISERRALSYEDNDDYDPNITVDINEYLIENWPTLTLKQRTSVWSLCQNDEDFDLESIYEQIDDWVYQLAEDDPNVELGEDEEDDTSGVGFGEDEDDEDEDDENDDGSLDGYLIVDVISYLSDKYPNISEDQLFEISDHMNSDECFNEEVLCNYMDAYVKQYASEVDKTIDLTESSDKSE